MNTLALIQKQILKNRAQADARITVTKYRCVTCETHAQGDETHGTFCYRGRTYTK